MISFGERLKRAISSKGPLCVGIDPHAFLLERWGLEDTVNGVEYFSMHLLDVIGNEVAAVKPQVAFFERFGARGILILEKFLQRAREEFSLLTISDAKRGDIGSTMAAYARTWLDGESSLASDAVTLNPYLGYETLRPAILAAQAQGRGVFILVLTSNPEGLEVQGASTHHRQSSVAGALMQRIADDNEKEEKAWAGPGEERQYGSPAVDDYFVGSVGCVIGATMGERLAELGIDLGSARAPVLLPGFGQQGGDIGQLRRYFSGKRVRALVNSGRDIACFGPQKRNLRDKVLSDIDKLSCLM